jgi:cell division protein FtsI (penicillin-binding protein 3)
MHRPLRRTSSVRRLNVTLVLVTLALSLIVGRLIQLQGVDASHYLAVSVHQQLQILSTPAVRGEIISSDGAALALTVQTDQVYADPPLMTESTQLALVAAKLAPPLRMTTAAILALLRNPTSTDYVVLKQSVDISTAASISKLNLPGVGLNAVYARSYPDGDLAAGLLGFADLRGTAPPTLTGMAGLEYSFNSLLAGRAGKEAGEFGPSGLPIPGTQATIKTAIPAGSVRLTIQSDIQWEAERACAAEVLAVKGMNCSVVVMEPGTGQILALAQYPTFNPAGPSTRTPTTDIPVANIFAPGSTAKVITAAAAFEHGGQTPLSSYLVPDQFRWHGFPFHDAESHPTQRYTIAGIIAHSLNDGMVQVADHVTPQQQYAEFRAFGIGSPASLNLPDESAGILPNPSHWYGNERYILSFGQGVDVTAVQMASVYATIANGGVRVAPSIVAGTTSGSGRYRPAARPARRRVLQRRTAAELMSILEQVPIVYAQAGESWGIIPGYTVAAKTGTAQEQGPQGNYYGSSFIGIAPATSPKLVVAVNLQDPRKGSYFGIDVAGPVFNAVMKFALQTLKILPDGGHVPYVPLTVP